MRSRRREQRTIGNSTNDSVEGEVESLGLLHLLGREHTSTVTRKDMRKSNYCVETTTGGKGRRGECREEFREKECRP